MIFGAFLTTAIVQSVEIDKLRFINGVKIKFMNPYTSGRTINKLVFSKMILNYEEYNNLEDKSEYDGFYEFYVNV